MTSEKTDLEIDASVERAIMYIKENRQDGLPTFKDIFTVTGYDNRYRNKMALRYMWLIEEAGYGDSIERELCNLVLNYGRNEADLKARLWEMNFGTYAKMYSYNGWPLMKHN